MSTWKIWLLGVIATTIGLIIMALVAILTLLSTAFLIGGGVTLIILYLGWEKSSKKPEEPYNDKFWKNKDDR